ncbi:MAG: site-specific integrase [Ktedonobacterales bacterium]|nr:site-specific integrase [Ktedonobacterales bacterium]
MARRRGKNEGTIRERSDGRWEGRVLLDSGKKKIVYGKTRDEVRQQVNQIVRDKEAGLQIVTERQTLGQYLESWLPVVKQQVDFGTYRRYRNFAQTHIIPALGRVQLTKVTPQQLQKLYTKLQEDGLSTTTVFHLHSALHRALKDALKMGLIQRNVTEMVSPPRRRHHEMIPLSKDQARALLTSVFGDKFEAVFVLALTTGMREGEIFGLSWPDVDLAKKSLVVRVGLKEAEKGRAIGKTKTTSSRRRIALSQNVVDALTRHRERQREEKTKAGELWDSSFDLVFPNHFGRPLIPDNFVKRHFKPRLKQLGISEDTRFHDLRHTCATLLLADGVNIKVVSEMLGHADISITLRIYAHVLPGMHEIAADSMDRLLDEQNT